MADNLNWYVVHTYSGYENTVKATIEKYVENRHLQDVIHEISIPMETVTEITDGALESFLGTVEEVDLDRGKVRVVVSMFGRETPVELELDQVEPISR